MRWLEFMPGCIRWKGRVRRDDESWAPLIEAAPYALVTIGYALLRKHALVHATGQFDPTHGTMDVLRTLPLVLAFYLDKLLVPVGLTGLYYTPYVTHALASQFVWPALILAIAGVGLWYWNRREGNSTVAFAGLWLLVGLAPALYLRNFANGDFVRDRYIYLPSIGFAILLAMGLRRLPGLRTWNAKVVQITAILLVCAAYVGASLSQQVHWASDLLVLVRGSRFIRIIHIQWSDWPPNTASEERTTRQ